MRSSVLIMACALTVVTVSLQSLALPADPLGQSWKASVVIIGQGQAAVLRLGLKNVTAGAQVACIDGLSYRLAHREGHSGGAQGGASRCSDLSRGVLVLPGETAFLLVETASEAFDKQEEALVVEVHGIGSTPLRGQSAEAFHLKWEGSVGTARNEGDRVGASR